MKTISYFLVQFNVILPYDGNILTVKKFFNIKKFDPLQRGTLLKSELLIFLKVYITNGEQTLSNRSHNMLKCYDF